MSQWSDSLSGHRVWKALEEWDAAIKQALSQKGINQETVETISRISSVYSFASNRLKLADPHLYWPELLDVLANNATQIASGLRHFAELGDSQHLASANATASNTVQTCSHFHAPSHPEEFVGAREAAETYRRGLEVLLKEAQASAANVRKDFEVLRERFAELSELSKTERANILSMTTTLQEQFTAAQEQRRTEHESLIKRSNEHTLDVLTEMKGVVESAEAAYKNLQLESRAKYEHLITETLEKFALSATIKIEHINKSKAKVDELVGIVTDKSIVAGHTGVANKAEKTTFIWHGITLFALLCVAAVAISLVKWPLSSSGGFDLNGLAARVFIAVSFSVLASYAGVQAARYQRQERENRRKALELAALRPYIAELPKEQQTAFAIEIGKKMFGNAEPVYDADAPSPTNVIGSLTNFAKVLIEAKAGKDKP